MKTLPARLGIAAAILIGSTSYLFGDLGDVIAAALKDAASHYQAPPHYSNPSDYSPYTPAPLKADPVSRNQHAYDVGYRVGQDDFHHHLSKHFTRHPDLYDKATHDSFASGYERGYDVARDRDRREQQYRPPRTSPRHVESPLYPSGYYPYSAPPKNADKETRSRHGYEVGYRIGQDDYHHGHSKHYTRHPDMYDKDTQHNFALGYEHGYDKARNLDRKAESAAAARRLVASVKQGRVVITQGGRTVSSLKTAAPNVETYRFTPGQKQIVIKSRGNHGPATVELFDVHSGVLRDKVLAYAIRGGRPSWARGMED